MHLHVSTLIISVTIYRHGHLRRTISMSDPSRPPDIVSFRQDSSRWRQRSRDDTEAFSSPEEYRAWQAAGRSRRLDPPRSMPWLPRDSWSPKWSHLTGPPAYSASGSTTRDESSGSRRRAYHSASFAGTSSRLSPTRRSFQPVQQEQEQDGYPPRHRRATPSPKATADSLITAPTAPPFPSSSPLFLRGVSRVARPDSAPPLIALPSKQYIELSKRKDDAVSSAKTTPKLLVLDLNGAIIYRTDRTTAERRKSYPRPYLSCLLEYLFLPEPLAEPLAEPDVSSRTRPWEVFVWSSAQPLNVRTMVELGFGTKWIEGVWDSESRHSKAEREKRGEGRLLGVWARDKMGLNEADYCKLDFNLIYWHVPAE